MTVNPESGVTLPESETAHTPASKSPYVDVDAVTNPYGLNLKYLLEMVERKDKAKLAEAGGVEGLLRHMASDMENGIAASTVEARRAAYGRNETAKPEPASFLEFLLDALSDKIIIILGIAACVSIVFGMTLPGAHSGEVERSTGWIEGTAILISITIVAMVSSVNNYEKAKKFEEMAAEQALQVVQVIRDGTEVSIDSSEVVVGDILVLESGVNVVSDGVYVHGTDLKCDESAMTGETDMVRKGADRDPFFLSGTQLQEGSGRMLVVLVGPNSYRGQMMEAVTEEAGETPLQEHLAHLADDVGKLGAAGAVVLVIALYIKEGVRISNGKEATASAFLNYLILAITVIVVAIPEGLPLAVTIALAFSMKAMMDDNCLVRVLASCETMGAATAVCSDKTGTLTTNVMTVVQGVVSDEEFVIEGYGLAPRHSDVVTFPRDAPRLAVDVGRMVTALAHNSTARQQTIDGRLQWVGNKTEHGLLGFVSLVQRDYVAIRNAVPEKDKKTFPFNSTKKRMTTLVTEGGSTTAYVKGASEVVLAGCTRYVDKSGAVVPLTAEKKDTYMAIITDMADQGNRTIGVAYYELSGAFPEDEPESESMTLVGILGIQDPIRPEVPRAVAHCHTAGITVRMVTGDNLNTAIAIAKKCGIYSENGWDKAMTGVEFRAMYNDDRAALLEIVPRLRVLARSSPTDKHILVGLLQELGEVVGVTGDGTNDAPALKLSDVGFAMQDGTDVAKGAADMILMDNNFASVVNAVKWGRSVNDNIKKFLQFQLTINVGGVLLTVIGSLASETNREPFTPVQLLWLNLIMDTLAALALATERPSDELLMNLPVFKQSPLVTNRMRLFIVMHGALQVSIIFLHMFSSYSWMDAVEGDCYGPFVNGTNATINVALVAQRKACEVMCERQGGVFRSDRYCQQGDIHSTIIFNVFIWMQIFNIFNARILDEAMNPFHGVFSYSRALLAVCVGICLVQSFAVEIAGSFMQTEHLDWKKWLICIAFGAIEIFFGFLVRIIPFANDIPLNILEKWEHERKMRRALGVRSSSPVPGASHLRLVHAEDPSIKAVAATVRKGSAWGTGSHDGHDGRATPRALMQNS